MIKLRKIEFFRSLLYHERILGDINDCHRLLSDALACFSVSTFRLGIPV